VPVWLIPDSLCFECQCKITVNTETKGVTVSTKLVSTHQRKVWQLDYYSLHLTSIYVHSFSHMDHYLCHHMFLLLLLLPLLSLYDSSWNNTVPKDLFDALEQQRTEDNIDVPPVQEFFEPWTTQPGYPVINVSRTTNSTITVTQVSRAIWNHNSKPFTLKLLVQHAEHDCCIQHCKQFSIQLLWVALHY
jgi:glycerophosphoryl diester phosphodiesterase